MCVRVCKREIGRERWADWERKVICCYLFYCNNNDIYECLDMCAESRHHFYGPEHRCEIIWSGKNIKE